jgi:transcriptional regulator with XRE-family HTH domain
MPRKGSWPPTGFAQRLQELRQAAGLTQRQLAARTEGIYFMTISRMERAENEPTWPMVLTLARALGVSVLDFLPGGENNYNGRPTPRPNRTEKKS